MKINITRHHQVAAFNAIRALAEEHHPATLLELERELQLQRLAEAVLFFYGKFVLYVHEVDHYVFANTCNGLAICSAACVRVRSGEQNQHFQGLKMVALNAVFAKGAGTSFQGWPPCLDHSPSYASKAEAKLNINNIKIATEEEVTEAKLYHMDSYAEVATGEVKVGLMGKGVFQGLGGNKENIIMMFKGERWVGTGQQEESGATLTMIGGGGICKLVSAAQESKSGGIKEEVLVTNAKDLNGNRCNLSSISSEEGGFWYNIGSISSDGEGGYIVECYDIWEVAALEVDGTPILNCSRSSAAQTVNSTATHPEQNNKHRNACTGGVYDRYDGANDGLVHGEMLDAMVTIGMSAAKLWGVSPEDLSCLEDLSCALTYRAIRAINEVVHSPLDKVQSEKACEALLKATYCAEYFILAKVNENISGHGMEEEYGSSPIGVLEIFGFEMLDTNNLEQICINYTNEELEEKLNKYVFKLEQDEYGCEGILWEFIFFPDNQYVLDLVDRKHTGILALLDERFIVSRSNDQKFIRYLYDKCDEHTTWFSATSAQRVDYKFSIEHYADPVEKNKDQTPASSANLLKTSQFDLLAQIQKYIRLEGRDGRGSVATKSVGLAQLRSCVEFTVPHYIRCSKPNDELVPNSFDPKMIVDQSRCCGVLEAVRVSRPIDTKEKLTDKVHLVSNNTKLPKGHRDSTMPRGLFLSIRNMMLVFVLAFLSSGLANAGSTAKAQGMYMSEEMNDVAVVDRRDNMDTSSTDRLEAEIAAYLAKYPIPIIDDALEEDEDEVEQDRERVSLDGSRSLAVVQDKLRDQTRRSLAMEIKNHVLVSAASTHRPLEYHIGELSTKMQRLVEHREGNNADLGQLINEIFSDNDDLLEDINSVLYEDHKTRVRQLKEVAERHSNTIQERFELIGSTDDKPHYRFIPSEIKNAHIQNEVHDQFGVLKMKMNTFKVHQKKVFDSKRPSPQLMTPRRSNDEIFITLNKGERRLSTPEDCNDEDDLCVETTSLVVEAATSIDDVNAVVGSIVGVFDAFEELHDLVGTLKTLASTLKTAFNACKGIPYVGQTLFQGLYYMMTALKTLFTNIHNYSRRVVNEVFPRLRRPLDIVTNTLGTLQDNLNDFATVVVGVTTLRTPQCMEEFIVNLSEFDPYQVLSFLKTEILTVINNVIEPISTFLKTNQIWLSIYGPLEDFVTSDVFQWLDANLIGPLEPITAFLATTVTINNFPAIPYNVGLLGPPRCKDESEVGYRSDFLNHYKDKCKEVCPSDYDQTSSKCKETCASIGYSDDSVFQGCVNKKITRDKHTCRGGCWGNCPSGYAYIVATGACRKRCSQYASQGYSIYEVAPGTTYCYKDSCPSGWDLSNSPFYGKWCVRTSSTEYRRRKHDTTCSGLYPEASNVIKVIDYIGNVDGGFELTGSRRRLFLGNLVSYAVNNVAEVGVASCVTDCNPGDHKAANMCWPQGDLTVAVQDIFDRVEEMLSYFLPDLDEVIGLFIDSIDSVISLLLENSFPEIYEMYQLFSSIVRFDFNAIIQMISSVFNIDFPTIPNIDDYLRFDFDFGGMLDTIPDFEGLFTDLLDDVVDLPSTLLDKITGLTSNFDIDSSWLDCADSADPVQLITCMGTKMPAGIAVPEFLDFNLFDGISSAAEA